jgi:cobalt-zinc-cadmium efflux system protein
MDPLIGVLIGILILWSAWSIVRESVDILMESTPTDIDVDAMVRDISAVEGVRGVHDLHVWSITRGMRTLSAHLVTDDLPISEATSIQTSVNEVLYHNYNINHATLQLECNDCMPSTLYCAFGEITQHH